MNLEQVSEMAKRVAAEHEALEDAKDDKGKAEDEHLHEVVEALKPALPAMSSRMAAAMGGVLVDRRSGIFLDEDGTWRRLKQPEGQAVYTMVISERDVLDVLNLGSVVAILVQNLYSQLGSREEVTLKIQDETRAVLLLTSLLVAPPRAKR